MTDDEILNAAITAADALDATRVSEMRPTGWHATTIFDGDTGLLRFGRLVEKVVRERCSEAVERDAARYRWLRDVSKQGARTADGEGPLVVSDRPSLVPRYLGPLFGDSLDATIDAAMGKNDK